MDDLGNIGRGDLAKNDKLRARDREAIAAIEAAHERRLKADAYGDDADAQALGGALTEIQNGPINEMTVGRLRDALKAARDRTSDSGARKGFERDLSKLNRTNQGG